MFYAKDFSKIKEGVLRLNIDWVNISEILKEAISLVEFRAKERGLKLLLLIHESVPK